MADLGSIGFFPGQFVSEPGFDAQAPVSLLTPGNVMIPVHTDIVLSRPSVRLDASAGDMYIIEGHVSEQGTDVEDWLVRIYRRDNGVFLGETRTDALGLFTFYIVGFDGEATCIAYDDTTVIPNYNALVFDRVIPILL